jgi:hypothetical protein
LKTSGIMPQAQEFTARSPDETQLLHTWSRHRRAKRNHWLRESVACKQCTHAAEHAAANRSTNRLRTEYIAMQPRRAANTTLP